MMEYVARFTELACFADDYVATDMTKVKRFENGLKYSIRGRIVGLRLLHGWDNPDHRERDRGCSEHSGYGC